MLTNGHLPPRLIRVFVVCFDFFFSLVLPARARSLESALAREIRSYLNYTAPGSKRRYSVLSHPERTPRFS